MIRLRLQHGLWMLALLFCLLGCSKKYPRSIFRPVLWGEDTQYAAGYSERAFDAVKMGMSEDQVHALLGDPLRILVMSGGRHVRMIDIENGNQITSYPDLPEDADASVTHEIHYYTKAARGGSWYVRAVTFTPDALVSKITKTFYAD